MRGLRQLFAAVMALTLLAACTDDGDADAGGAGEDTGGTYRATIERTEEGVPHVSAEDLGSLAFGQGWASFEDHSCDLADQLVMVGSERARWFGPGEDGEHVDSDFAWKAIGIVERAEAEWPEQDPEARELLEGFAAGWSAALGERGTEDIEGWCAGAEWVRPLTGLDVYTYARSVTLLASSAAVADYLGTAQPPEGDTPPTTESPLAAQVDWGLPEPTELASNGWAIGAGRSADGEGGLLLANPHFPWEGALRFWEVHLRIPGELDIYGAQLSGLPGVGIGFTEGMAWTHTVSAGNRFTAYRLSLVPGRPTAYRYDDEERELTATEATIEVLEPDGGVRTETRTLWSSHHGPILDLPGFEWDEETALAIRDANLDNDEFVGQYLAMNQATTLEELRAAHEEHQGVPLFNTVAVGADGEAWYVDSSATPALSEEAIAEYEAARESDPLVALAAENRAVLLDGSTSATEWIEVEGARDPGLVPWADMPQVERDDYVFNANDSFWVPHATELLAGDYSPLHGLQDTERSWRTRENAWVLDELVDVDLDVLTEAALRNEAGTARRLREPVVAACRDEPRAEVDGSEVDLTEACDVLAGWDGRYDVDSVGAVLWREFWSSDGDLDPATPFDPARPVDTPDGVADPAQARAKLGRAVSRLGAAGVALDTPLGEVQRDGRVTDDPTGIGGGYGSEGITNAIGWSSSSTTLEERPQRPEPVAEDSTLTPEGYWINSGTSFLMAVALGPDGPEARTILTYGPTQDRSSPLFTSQMRRFAAEDFKAVARSDEAIEAARVGEPRTVTGQK